MIRGANARSPTEGSYELGRHFARHFLGHHPGKQVCAGILDEHVLGAETVDFFKK
jgi:hypothetical protein